MPEMTIDRTSLGWRSVCLVALGGAVAVFLAALAAGGGHESYPQARLQHGSVPLAAEEFGECKLTDAEFFQQLDTMTSWPATYSVYKKNLPACPDDGMFADGYSDVVVVAVAKQWATLKEFQRLGTKDPGFRSWALGHIDATTSDEDLQEIVKNASAKCPKKSMALCEELARRAKEAIAEQ